jgi:hypothetical protein
MTYRERRQRRAARLREWAAGRAAKAEAAFDRATEIGDQIQLGQPVLVGDHSERRHRRDLARICAAGIPATVSFYGWPCSSAAAAGGR